MSRNLPMSNSELRKRSSEIRNRGSTLSGYSPRVMWARLSSQRTSRSSGNCSRYSVKCWIARREPVGIGVDGGRRDRQDARAFAAAHDAIVVLAAAQRGHALEINDRIKTFFGQLVAFLDPGPCLLENLVGAVRFSFVIEEHGFRDQQGEPLVIGLTGVRQAAIDHLDVLVAQSSIDLADFLQGGIGLPLLEDGRGR